RRRRRDALGGPHHERGLGPAMLHVRIPGAGGIGAGDNMGAVDAKNGFHQMRTASSRRGRFGAASAGSSPLGSSISTSRVETFFPRSMRTITLSGSSATW